MIPISAAKRFNYLDEESGITYKFRYLLADIQEEYNNIVGDMYQNVLAFQRLVSDSKKAKDDDVIELERLSKENEKLALIGCSIKVRLINMFLVGWESKDLTIEPFPESNPSSMFRPGDVEKMGDIIQGIIGELSGNGSTETLKNSQRQHTLPSTENTTAAVGAQKKAKKGAGV